MNSFRKIMTRFGKELAINLELSINCNMKNIFFCNVLLITKVNKARERYQSIFEEDNEKKQKYGRESYKNLLDDVE